MDDTTLHDRLQQLSDRYYLTVSPLLLLLGVGVGSSPLLAWTASLLLLAATINKAAFALR